ncbi:MAG: hypothetical protein ACR2PL_07895 [Dehalococcoidia bacterium]
MSEPTQWAVTRGSSSGAEVLRDWFGRAGIHLEPRHLFQRNEAVVVEQDAVWRAPEAGESAGHQTAATVFAVHGGRVVRVIRHADLASALTAAGLSETDRVDPA